VCGNSSGGAANEQYSTFIGEIERLEQKQKPESALPITVSTKKEKK
jgi:uncharacterized protein (UPF0335 family)